MVINYVIFQVLWWTYFIFPTNIRCLQCDRCTQRTQRQPVWSWERGPDSKGATYMYESANTQDFTLQNTNIACILLLNIAYIHLQIQNVSCVIIITKACGCGLSEIWIFWFMYFVIPKILKQAILASYMIVWARMPQVWNPYTVMGWRYLF